MQHYRESLSDTEFEDLALASNTTRSLVVPSPPHAWGGNMMDPEMMVALDGYDPSQDTLG